MGRGEGKGKGRKEGKGTRKKGRKGWRKEKKKIYFSWSLDSDGRHKDQDPALQRKELLCKS